MWLPELVERILDFICCHKTFGQLCSVSKDWKEMVERAWKMFSSKEGLLNRLEFFAQHFQKDWKWMVSAYVREIGCWGTEKIRVGYMEVNEKKLYGEFLNPKRTFSEEQKLIGGEIHYDGKIEFMGIYLFSKWHEFGLAMEKGREVYKGQYYLGKRDGYGKLYWPEFRVKFIGNWKKGWMHGSGTYFFDVRDLSKNAKVCYSYGRIEKVIEGLDHWNKGEKKLRKIRGIFY